MGETYLIGLDAGTTSIKGIIVDSDALLVRAQEALGPMMTAVLKEVNEKSIITNLLPSFTIPDKFGREMTLHSFTELRAQLVAQGGEAMEQRPEIIEESTIRLDKWQVVLGIFDEALSWAKDELLPQAY